MGEYIRENLRFLNVSCGKLVSKNRDTGETKKIDGWTGYLVGIHHTVDQFEGQDVPKWRVTFMDEDQSKAVVTFTAETSFEKGFFRRIGNVNFDLPLTVGVMPWKPDPEKTQGFKGDASKVSLCWMNQAGEKIAADEDWPEIPKVVVGTKEVKDFSLSNAYIRQIVQAMYEKGVTDTRETKDVKLPLNTFGPQKAPDAAAPEGGMNEGVLDDVFGKDPRTNPAPLPGAGTQG